MDGADVCWIQSDPADRGRTSLYRRDASGLVTDMTPQWDLRTSIHEYGGTPAAVRDQQVCFFDKTTSRVWAIWDGHAAPVTPEGPWVYGGFCFLDDHRVVCVREDHSPNLAEPTDAIVLLDLSGENPGGGEVIAQGADFYFSPTASETGWIAWMEYDHPSMPWDSTRIRALDPGGVLHTIADTPDTAAVCPQWDRDGSLVFLWDESGYWNFYRWANGRVTRLNDHPYDFCIPQWVLSQPCYCLLPPDPASPSGSHKSLDTTENTPGSASRIGCSWWQAGMARLGILEPDGTLTQFGIYGTVTVFPTVSVEPRDIPGVPAQDNPDRPVTARGIVGVGSPATAYGLRLLDWGTGESAPIVQESEISFDPGFISVPTEVHWRPDGSDEVAGWYYPPIGDSQGEPACPPPVIVLAHGGPTSYSPAVFSLVTHYFTTRGIAILDVNYSGSSTMGRAYRQRLNAAWGVADVRDCAAGARYLAGLGLADPSRMAIMGSSAGGFTALAALTRTDVFSAGISLYGVSDLEALARDTTKFESHYTQTLVAPYPDGREVYVERSPLTHADQLSCPLLLLQGTLDQVVPPDQARMMYDASRNKGLDAELVFYDDEGHGFRQAATIEDTYTRILSFLGRVWGFTPDPTATR